MNKIKKVLVILSIALFVFGSISPIPVSAATAPSLGAAEGYSVYGDAGVTNDLSATTHV